MKKKLVIILLIILIVIAGLGTAAYFVVSGNSGKDKKPTIDEVVAATVSVDDITTNLKSDSIIRIGIKLETDSAKAKEELEKRDFQVKDNIISILAGTSAGEIEGDKGREAFKQSLKEKVNSYLQEGKVQKVYITSFNLQ
ncbi:MULTISPECIES: flagellar basal body-associated protein FliL [Bacillus]|uniref:flagellar basal body-associated protein FliL n=1 Tax=Bacillus TaxID=1386 RepID=UPI0005193D7E|nr:MULTISPECIES: flagellar basal body-associated protein FliL [Bacillus]ATV01223.1 flagellar basal body-associated protein FliL [Bacillus velezensis]AWG38619.1 flagellar basal body-associated protein FliL [Bacillus velezensis]MCM3370304.1 flagellar basal body-associated protein FliL [Bacillus velezensis]MED3656849.1 flagellar basal body-associated protein FliL [Bacillus velezensis]MED3701669.1 flagellar basal body-associated protein FliL [Bacillus velezensis]